MKHIHRIIITFCRLCGWTRSNPDWILIILAFIGIHEAIPQNKSVVSSGLTVKDIIENLSRNYAALATAAGEVRCSQLNERSSATSVGAFILAYPLKFRVDLTGPLRQQIIADGQSVWLFYPDSSRAVQFDLSDPAGQIHFITSGYSVFIPNVFSLLGDRWQYSLRDVWEGIYVVRAIPLVPVANIAQMLIKVDPRAKQILAWELFDQANDLILQIIYSDFIKFGPMRCFPGNATIHRSPDNTTFTEEIKFKNMAFNQVPEADVFRFEPPPGTEITQP